MPDLDEQIRELIARRPKHFPGMSRPGETYDRYKGWSDRSAAAILTVLELHKPNPHPGGLGPYCEPCRGGYEGCEPWPCRTVLAMAKELGIEAPGE
jgi:hypothetical protein